MLAGLSYSPIGMAEMKIAKEAGSQAARHRLQLDRFKVMLQQHERSFAKKINQD